MKKLVMILAVVLMASTASAVTDFTILVNGNPWDGGDVAPSDYIFVTMTEDTAGLGGLGDFMVDVSAGDYTADSAGVADFDMLAGATVTDRTDGFYGVFTGMNMGNSPTGDILWFEFHVPELDPSTYIVIDPVQGSWNGVFAVAGDADGLAYEVLHVIPEPMTIALLGLGGLFLRRRK